MREKTVSQILRNRNLWHTIAIKPAADQERPSIQVSHKDIRRKQLLDHIEELNEDWRIIGEHSL